MQQDASFWLSQLGYDSTNLWSNLALAAAIVTVAVVASLIVRVVLQLVQNRMLSALSSTFVEVIKPHRLPTKLARFVPVLVLSWGGSLLLAPWPELLAVADKVLQLWLLLVTIMLLFTLFECCHDLLQRHRSSQRLPLRSIVQLAQLFVILVGFILVMALLLDRSPLYLLSGLGVATGLLLLIFRETILGFVAGMQLSLNDMVRRGDWVQLDAFGADGDVLEVSLTTVKVRNWDNTISMIPAHAMVSTGFKNWRGMSESGGRRIKRALLLDQHSVDFISEQQLQHLQQLNLLSPYLELKQQELSTANASINNSDILGNGRRLTNVGCFRAYLVAYLRQHPLVHQQQTLLVRQLAPNAEGLPLEIYCFSNDTRWGEYEALQADIFDHALAILPQFGLKTMQHPTGADLRHLAGNVG